MASRKTLLSVGDLRKYLAKTGFSPEQFAREVKLSHMTIRRWLKKGDDEILHSKYLTLLGPRLGRVPVPDLPMPSIVHALKNKNMAGPMSELETRGAVFLARPGKEMLSDELKTLEMRVQARLKNNSREKVLANCCQLLTHADQSHKSSVQSQSLAVGALLYFVDPGGAPGETPLVDYFGLFAVLSIAINRIR